MRELEKKMLAWQKPENKPNTVNILIENSVMKMPKTSAATVTPEGIPTRPLFVK